MYFLCLHYFKIETLNYYNHIAQSVHIKNLLYTIIYIMIYEGYMESEIQIAI